MSKDDPLGKTPHIEIAPPRQLALDDDYQSKYNQQWDTIATTINKLLGYVKEMEEE